MTRNGLTLLYLTFLGGGHGQRQYCSWKLEPAIINSGKWIPLIFNSSGHCDRFLLNGVSGTRFLCRHLTSILSCRSSHFLCSINNSWSIVCHRRSRRRHLGRESLARPISMCRHRCCSPLPQRPHKSAFHVTMSPPPHPTPTHRLITLLGIETSLKVTEF